MIAITDTLAKKKQTGIAMLMLVIALALAISIYYFSTVSLVDVQLDSSFKTQTELKKAKRALLDYALVNWRTPGNGGNIGRLPCPDLGVNEGVQNGPCGVDYANSIGFFPWRTLGIDIPRDSSGNCFLYVVSPAYKSNPIAALNRDSYGQIQIVDSTGTTILQGVTPESRPVAVIIAPGKALSDQARAHDAGSLCGKDYANIAAYLDDNGTIDNAAIDTVDNFIDFFVNNYSGSEDGNDVNPLNDRLITITHQEFWDVMESTIIAASFEVKMKSLTEAIALCLAEYGKDNEGYLPMPAPLNLNGGEYRRNADYDDSNVFTAGYSGRLPYKVSNANIKLSEANPALLNVSTFFANTNCSDIDTVVLNNINFNGNTGADNGEYFDLWQNWKDHFFYAVSKSHNPDAYDGVAPALTSNCSGDCLEVNATPYAAIVFFAGLKDIAQQRYTRPFDGALAKKTLDPVNVDDKDDVVNYLENGHVSDFPAYAGNSPLVITQPADDGAGDFTLDGNPTNDIRFCIKPDMAVESC